ncbi:AraC family transcriptional regulator [Cohnella thailandensis]|uniref:AraC family transcriptional regulator n=1 Tax=Cohnella thailandensis TaxID=557557 RepID=A0A841SQH4_9BACL|nr:AraC family transcriptional regulator [Cohnella thailandensis]MBB6632856.1 AraC family transcriptional regulator [Cohnella thailandensis]MBP1975450.1 AraC-like DNA-binding protein [Cohnella thailandensis]
MKRRIVPSSPAETLPLQLESIGVSPEQEKIVRPKGYPYYHWLQTVEGEGEFTANGRTWKMTKRSGVLLSPHIPHRYEAIAGPWHTAFITFHGSLAAHFVQSFGWRESERFHWEAGNDSLLAILADMLTRAEAGGDPSGWRTSSDLYRFLTHLKTNARTDNRPSMSKRFERIQLLLDWLETEFANPAIGLAEMSHLLEIGERQLNEKFRELYGLTAYAYLIQLRIRKAKEWLPSRQDWTVRRIGEAVGFRDASHFVATFRRLEGMTPDSYRKLHGG